MISKLSSLVTAAITAPPLPEQPALMKDAKEALSINPSPSDPMSKAPGIPPNQFMEEDEFKRLSKRAKAMIQNKTVPVDDDAADAVKDGKSERAIPGNPVDAQNKADAEEEERDAVKVGIIKNPAHALVHKHREHSTSLQVIAHGLYDLGKYAEASETALAASAFDEEADALVATDHVATTEFRSAVEVASIVDLADGSDLAELEVLAAEEASTAEVG